MTKRNQNSYNKSDKIELKMLSKVRGQYLHSKAKVWFSFFLLKILDAIYKCICFAIRYICITTNNAVNRNLAIVLDK